MNIIVVGGGIMGLSSAWALIRGGARVTLIEQHALPNPLGSSVDQHRLIRYPYGSARGYARMNHAAYDAWERLWRDLGVRLQIETGTLVLCGPGDNWVAESRAVLQAEGIQHEPLALDTLAERFPLVQAEGLEEAFHCEHGGLLRAEAIIGSLKHHLLDRGLRLLTRTRVQAVDGEAATVTLADGRMLTADRVLVTAGPWTNTLLPDLAEVARPSRQVAVYLNAPADLAAHWYRAPMLLDIGASAGFYAVPPRVCGDGMRLGLKVSDHRFGPTADPGSDREPRQEEIEAILEPVRKRLVRGEEYRVASAKTCFYDVEASEQFQFRQIGARGFAFCGSSGHGFKFGACLGEQMAAAVLERAEYQAVAGWIAGGLQSVPYDYGIKPEPASASESTG